MENLQTIIDEARLLLEKNDDAALGNFLQELNISEAKEIIDEFPNYGSNLLSFLPIGGLYTFFVF